MRYVVRVMRVQTAERTVTATDPEAALGKIQEELEQPYAFLGRWETITVDAEVIDVRSTVVSHQTLAPGGALLLSVADAAKHVGISKASLYELLHRGEVECVQLGRRRLISRDALARFIEQNTRRG